MYVAMYKTIFLANTKKE